MRISDWSSDVCSSDLGLVYSRFNGPNQEILEDRLAVLDGADDSLVFSSGMSAIATLLLALVGQNDVIVHSGPLYAATETLIARILSPFRARLVCFPAGAHRADIDATMASATTTAPEKCGTGPPIPT